MHFSWKINLVRWWKFHWSMNIHCYPKMKNKCTISLKRLKFVNQIQWKIHLTEILVHGINRYKPLHMSVQHVYVKWNIFEAEWRIYASTNWVISGSDNGLSPARCQSIIWPNSVFWSIGSFETYLTEILFKTNKFSFKKTHLKISIKFELWRKIHGNERQ